MNVTKGGACRNSRLTIGIGTDLLHHINGTWPNFHKGQLRLIQGDLNYIARGVKNVLLA